MSGGGMLELFGGLDDDDVDVRAVFAQLVEAGAMEVVDADDAGEPRYRLTAAGIRYVENVVFPRLGVTPAEAAAWLAEQLGDES